MHRPWPGGNGTIRSAPKLFRRVYHTARLGPAVWLTTDAAAIPAVDSARAIPLYSAIIPHDTEVRADAATYLSELLSEVSHGLADYLCATCAFFIRDTPYEANRGA